MRRTAVAGVLAGTLVATGPLLAQRGDRPVEATGPASDTLELAEAISVALRRAPDVRSARADAAAERAARWADWGAFLPTADATASFSRITRTTFSFEQPEGTPEERETAVTGEVLGVDQALTFRWTLLEGGRRFADLAAGSRRARAAAHRLGAAERRTVAQIRVSYYRALRTRRLEAIARRELNVRRRELQLAERRFRIAAIDRAGLLGVEGQVRDAEIQLLDARERNRRARRDLGVRMGAPGRVDGRVALVEAPPAPGAERLDPEALVARALRDHPELGALSAEVSVAEAAVRAGRLSYLPTIALAYSTRRSEALGSGGPFFNLDPRNSADAFTLSVRWELFTGFRRRERTARSAATLRRRRAEHTRRRLEIERVVRDLAGEVLRRERRLELLGRRVAVARERLRLTRKGFRVGSVSFLELQGAVGDLARAERSLVVERYDHLIARAEMERWAGGLGREYEGP